MRTRPRHRCASQFVTMNFPQIKLQHFFSLCDDTGLFQHAHYSVPNRKKGYSTDDVARAIVFLCNHCSVQDNPRAMKILSVCVSFLHFANRPDGAFHNFLSYNRRWVDRTGSEDSHGRAIWAAGTASRASALDAAARNAAEEIFRNSAGRIVRFRSPRSRSFGMLGCAPARDIDVAQDMLREGGNFLVRLFKDTARKGWQWFEPYLTYCNARIPHALYLAYDVFENEEYLDVAEESMRFLINVMFEEDMLDVPGNHAWFEAGGTKSTFDQQPVEAGTMVEALVCAFHVTRSGEYLDRAAQALEWYHGKNRIGRALIDPSTGACYDGLMPSGVNKNQGAEAVLSYLLARTEYDAAIRSPARKPGARESLVVRQA